jgi:hypothetical protein
MRSHFCSLSFASGTSGLNALFCPRFFVLKAMMDADLPVAEARLISHCVQRTTAHQLFPSLLTHLFFSLFHLAYLDTSNLHLCRMELPL